MIFHEIEDRIVLEAVKAALAGIPHDAPVHEADIKFQCTRQSDVLLDVHLVNGSVRRQAGGGYVVSLRQGIPGWEALWLVLHELAHIALGHCELAPELRAGDAIEPLERQADELATRWSCGRIVFENDRMAIHYASSLGENRATRPYRYRKDLLDG